MNIKQYEEERNRVLSAMNLEDDIASIRIWLGGMDNLMHLGVHSQTNSKWRPTLNFDRFKAFIERELIADLHRLQGELEKIYPDPEE